MNKIYKVQYNDALGTWVAVPEIAKGRSKSTSSAEHAESTASLSKPGKWVLTTLTAALLPVVSGQVLALEVDDSGNIVSGGTSSACYRSKVGSTAHGAEMVALCGTGKIDVTSVNAIGIGANIKIKEGSKDALLFGSNAVIGPDAESAMVFGSGSKATGNAKETITIGVGSESTKEKIISIGHNNKINVKKAIVIGTDVKIDESTTPIGAILIGNKAQYSSLTKGVSINADGQLTTGKNDPAAASVIANVTTLGNTNAKYSDFNGEVAKIYTKDSKGNYSPKNVEYAIGKGVAGVVSLGNINGETRRIQGVSAGALTEKSTDVINGSQLYVTNNQVGQLKDKVKDGKWTAGVSSKDNEGKDISDTIDVKLGETLNYVAGNNIILTPGDKKITVATKDDVTFKTVNITEGGTTIMDGQDIKVEKDKDGKVVIDKTTNKPVIVDKDGNKIQGDNSLDIVNVKYVKDNASNVASTDGSVTVKLYEGKQFLTEKDKDGNILKDKSGNIIYKTDSAGNKIVDPNFPSEGKNFDIAVNKQAVVDGAKIPVVYTVTKADGKEAKVSFDDKNELHYLKDDGTLGNKVEDKLAKNVHASMNNADGDVNTPMTLGNLGKGTKDNDAGNVAQLNDILAQLGDPDDQSVSVPKIGANGSVEGLEYYLTSGNPYKDHKKPLDINQLEDKYEAEYKKLSDANEKLSPDKQKTAAELRRKAIAEVNKGIPNNKKIVTSVGAAISNLDKAVNQAITVKADHGTKTIDKNGDVKEGPDSQGVYLGGGFSIVGGKTELNMKDKDGKAIDDPKNIKTTINGNQVEVALEKDIHIDSATVNNVDGDKDNSVVNVGYLNAQMPVVYTYKKDNGETIQVKKKGNKYFYFDSQQGKDINIDAKDVNASMKTIDGNIPAPSGEKVATDAPTLAYAYTDKDGKVQYLTKDQVNSDGKIKSGPNAGEETTKVITGMFNPATKEKIAVDLNKRIEFQKTVSDGAGGKKAEGTLVLDHIAGVGDFTNEANATKAVNGADLNNAIAGVLSYVDQNKGTNGDGWKLMGDDQSTVEEVNPKGTVQIKGDGNNITVGVQKSGDIVEANVKLSPELKNMEKIEFVPGDDGKSSSVSISKNGIKAGEKKITNVADGAINASSHDAVNGSQLYRLKQDIDNIDNRASAGTAAAMATAGLSQVYLPGKSMVSAAASHYRGQSAIAVGLSTISDNGKWIIKGAANANKEDLGVTVGVGYMW